MSQPEWKLVWATDCTALYEDTTGVYPPELAVVQTDEGLDERDPQRNLVYRFPLERCWQVTDDDGSTFLTDMNPERAVKTGDPMKDLPYPLSSYVPWFRDSLGEIARSCGDNVESLVKRLCSDDPGDLASAYQDIGGYHGFVNFDQEPQGWTEHEFASWPERGKKLPDWSDEHKAREFTDDEKLVMSRGFDAGNYGNAYESQDWETWRNQHECAHEDCPKKLDGDAEHVDGSCVPHSDLYWCAAMLGFFGSYSLDEIGSDREAFDECYWSAAGYHVVHVAGYTDDRGEEYLEESDDE